MHKKLLREIGRHLDVAKRADHAKYVKVEKQLSYIEGELDKRHSHTCCGEQHTHRDGMHGFHACPKCYRKCGCG